MTKLDIHQHNVVPMAAKKVWNVLRVVYFMLRKEISRRKLMSELNLVMKRGKIAGKAISGKAISGLMNFSHHGTGSHNSDRDRGRAAPSTSPASGEYEFSCSNSPVPSNYLNTHFFSSRNHFQGFFGCAHLPKTAGDEDAAAAADDDVASFSFGDAAVMAMIEAEETDQVSEVASPMLPGFGRTPMARQLRITDSPFPLKDDGDGGKVDRAAEEFIQKFYRALQKQKSG